MNCRRRTDHPIYDVMKIALVMIPVSIFMWKNASFPDWTEGKTIIEGIIVLAGAMGIKQGYIRKWK